MLIELGFAGIVTMEFEQFVVSLSTSIKMFIWRKIFYQRPGVQREGQAACVMANFNQAETLHHAAWINECQRNSGNREAWKNPSGPVMECAVLHHVTPRLETRTTPAPGMISVACIHLMMRLLKRPLFQALYLHKYNKEKQDGYKYCGD